MVKSAYLSSLEQRVPSTSQRPSVVVSQAPLSRDSTTFIIYFKPWLDLKINIQPVVDKTETLIMTDKNNYPEWYTPSLKYINMKKELLGYFPDEETWEKFGTERQLIALSNLLDFFKKTRNLTDQFPQLLSEVIMDNKNLVIKRALNFPNKLYEQLLLAVEGAQEVYPSFWDQPSSVTLAIIEEFLARRKAGCLAGYARLQDQDPTRSLVLSKEMRLKIALQSSAKEMI